MSVESATYISQLNSALPANTDLITEGDNHLNLIKSTLLATFPNFTATAITPTSADVNKIAGAATTGAVGFNVATQSASDNTTLAASTAHVKAAIAAATITTVLPSQTGNSGKVLGTNGTEASWVASSDVGSFTTLSASGNVTLGDATTDTLNVGANGIIKDASGNVGVGRAPNYPLDVYRTGTTTATVAAANDNVVAVIQAVGLAQANCGTLTSHPVVFIQGNAEAVRIDNSKNLLVTTPALLGYGTGAGGTVTQATSRTTGVTLNRPTGAITLFTAAGSATPATFTVTNSLVAATDIPVVVVKSSTNVYLTQVTAVAAGSFNITFWTTGGTASDAPVFNFSVGKGATS